jgi:hypothetical protein
VRWAAAGLAILVLCAAACGGGDEGGAGGKRVPASTWTADVCTATKAWREQVDARADQFQRERTPPDLTQYRISIVAYFDDTLRLTRVLAADVERAGTPNVEGGEEARGELEKIVAEGVDAYADALAAAKKLPVHEQGAFERALRRLVQSFGSRADQLIRRLDELRIRHLAQAFSTQPACAPSG